MFCILLMIMAQMLGLLSLNHYVIYYVNHLFIGGSPGADPKTDSMVGYKSRESETQIPIKRVGKAGSVSPPSQDIILPGLSGSRGQPRLETTRASSKPLTDKPYQVPTRRTDKQTRLQKYTESTRPDLQSVLPLHFLMTKKRI